MGLHASKTAPLIFADCRIPHGNLLGEVLDTTAENHPETRLINEVAKIKAERLLDLADEYF